MSSDSLCHSQCESSRDFVLANANASASENDFANATDDATDGVNANAKNDDANANESVVANASGDDCRCANANGDEISNASDSRSPKRAMAAAEAERDEICPSGCYNVAKTDEKINHIQKKKKKKENAMVAML